MVLISADAASSTQAPVYQSDWGFSLQHFKWEETGETSIQLVEETGLLYGLTQELAYRRDFFGWRTGASLFFGEMDYEGHTWAMVPVETDVTYIGATAFFDLEPAYQWPSGFLVKGIIGLGGRLWLRDLDDTKTESGIRVRGTEEWWWSIYGRAGAGLEYPFRHFGRVFADVGIKIPIYARNEATFFVEDTPEVDLEPEQEISPFIHIGWRWKKLRLRFFYDTLRFDASDRVESEGYELYQPESEADMIGFDLSYTFCF